LGIPGGGGRAGRLDAWTELALDADPHQPVAGAGIGATAAGGTRGRLRPVGPV